MADDTQEVIIPFLNRSSDCPKGSTEYDFKVLSKNQQRELNDLKIHTIRQNHLYLKEHPEIRVIIKILLREILVSKPRKVHEFLAEFVRRPQFCSAVRKMVETEQGHSVEMSAPRQSHILATRKASISLANIVFFSSLTEQDFKTDSEHRDVKEDTADINQPSKKESITQEEDFRYMANLIDSIVRANNDEPSISPRTNCEEALRYGSKS